MSTFNDSMDSKKLLKSNRRIVIVNSDKGIKVLSAQRLVRKLREQIKRRT